MTISIQLHRLEEALKEISKAKEKLIDVALRKDSFQQVTADTIDDYLESKGYLRINEGWTELSYKSASQYLELALRCEQMEWFDYIAPKDVPPKVAQQFLSIFTSNARFFCNGLFNVLDEHPMINPKTQTVRVIRAFPSPHEVVTQYHSGSLLKADPYDAPFGLIAVDDTHIGYILIPPSI